MEEAVLRVLSDIEHGLKQWSLRQSLCCSTRIYRLFRSILFNTLINHCVDSRNMKQKHNWRRLISDPAMVQNEQFRWWNGTHGWYSALRYSSRFSTNAWFGCDNWMNKIDRETTANGCPPTHKVKHDYGVKRGECCCEDDDKITVDASEIEPQARSEEACSDRNVREHARDYCLASWFDDRCIRMFMRELGIGWQELVSSCVWNEECDFVPSHPCFNLHYQRL